MQVKRRAFRRALAGGRPGAGIVAFLLAVAPACSSSDSPGTRASADGGGGDGATSDAGSSGDGSLDASDSGAAGIVVTSPAFAEGQPIPTANTCAGPNTSPEIDWTAGPAGTLSYALVVTDLSAPANIHWVVWDLPPATRTLPAMLPGDAALTSPVTAKQVDLRTNPEAGTTTNGFFGPCPRGNTHTYEFALHAMDVDTLPGVTTTSRSASVKTVVLAHSIAHGVLTGTSNAALPTDAGASTDAGNPVDAAGQ